MRLFKHAHKDGSGQEKHGNRGGKRNTADYEKLRRKFKASRSRSPKATDPAENSDFTNAFLRRAYKKYRAVPGDGVGTRARKGYQLKLAQRYASYRRGTRKTDPTPSFTKFLTAQQIRSVHISVDGAFARGAKGRTLPSKQDIIENPEGFRRTVGADKYTDAKVRRVKPTGRVKRTGK